MKTNELSGAALDWAVASCEFGGCEDWDGTLSGVDAVSDMQGGTFNPSTDWALGGAIIEREWINLYCVNDSLWGAEIKSNEYHNRKNGTTPLIAAMRSYVASKMGDEVNISTELL